MKKLNEARKDLEDTYCESEITIDYKTELGALGVARLLLSTGVVA